jgi:hypothetical protein
MALQHLRSGTANKRPIPTVMSAGQIAINTNEASPGLFFKDSNGDLVKVGPVHIGTSAPNSSPDSVAATALVTGTVYQILTVGTSDFTLVGASANTVGVIFTATGTTTGDGTVSGQQGVEKGEQWLDTTGGNYVLKIYDGTAWRSEAGEFVNVSGDTMTGALLLDNAASASAPDLSFDGDANTGIYSPGADQVAISTNGTGRLFIDSSGNVGIGTSTGDAKLTVNSSGARAFEIENAGSSDSKTLTINQGNANNGATNTVLDVGSSSGNSILTTGNVGIGTTSALTSAGFTGVTASGSTGGIYWFAKAGVQKGYLYGADDDVTLASTDTSGSIRLLTGGNNERVRIDSSGRLLVGTSSPVTTGVGVPLQIAQSNAGSIIALARNDTSTVSGNTLGRIEFFGNDSDGTYQSCAFMAAEADLDHATGDKPTRLVFSTTASTNSSPTERMRIQSSGRILLGTSSTTYASASWKTTSRVGVVTTTSSNSGDVAIECAAGSTSLRHHISFSNTNGVVGSISTSASATAYNTSSDHRLKENVVDIADGITRVKQLAPKRFNFIADAETTVDGFLAHEAQTVVPEAVTGTHNEVDDDGNPVYQGIDQSKLVPLLTAALQEAIGEIESLKARVSVLEAN